MIRRAIFACFVLPIACASRAPEGSEDGGSSTQPFVCENPQTFRFVPDTGDAAEAYLCFGFDVGALNGKNLRAVLWDPPDSAGMFEIHHATLYAVTTTYPDGPLVCDGMPPGSVGLHLWSPGGSSLVLPEDVALRLPAATQRFVIEAHTIRRGSGPVEEATVTLCEGAQTPAHLAAFIGYSAPIPALRPMHLETSQGSCTLGGDVHLWSVWPHMHLLGKEVTVDWVHTATPSQLVHVNPWHFHAQKTYPLSVDAQLGDQLTTQCTWQNNTNNYVFGGPLTEDEMCNTALIAWPAEAAFCQ